MMNTGARWMLFSRPRLSCKELRVGFLAQGVERSKRIVESVQLVVKSIVALVIILGLPVVGAIRAWRVAANLARKTLVPKIGADGLVYGRGYFGLFMLTCALVVYGLVAFGTFFLMKTGGASGVPLGLAFTALPIVWLVSEVLMMSGFSSASLNAEGDAVTGEKPSNEKPSE
jgi:hypothetical protein